MPPEAEPEAPEAYRTWRLCQTHGSWWSGGTASQPHLQLMEFAICSSAHATFMEEVQNMEQILLEDATSGAQSTIHTR